MADEDARARVLASLGIQRRRPEAADADVEAAGGGPEAAGGDPAAEAGDTSTAEAPAEAAAAPRRAPAEQPPARDARAGLGLKRRRQPGDGAAAAGTPGAEGAEGPAGAAEGGAAAGDPGAAASQADAPAARPTLGSDDSAVMLASLFKIRPQLRAQLPERLWALRRTHGRYIGDGRPERTLKVGFEPAFVLFVVPPYPDGQAPRIETKGKEAVLIDAPPHRQPRYVADGFVVDEAFNVLGDWFSYVVFRADGKPLEAAPAPEAEAPKKRDGLGLGIRRRSV